MTANERTPLSPGQTMQFERKGISCENGSNKLSTTYYDKGDGGRTYNAPPRTHTNWKAIGVVTEQQTAYFSCPVLKHTA